MYWLSRHSYAVSKPRNAASTLVELATLSVASIETTSRSPLLIPFAGTILRLLQLSIEDFYGHMPSNQPLHPTDLGLVLSYKCQCSCAHCLYNCGPQWVEWISPETLQQALETTLIWPEPIQVHLTGGEPFLNFPLLLRAVEIAASLGIPCYCETNAGWCVQSELVAKRFRALREAGLGAILISCSPFHAETVPPKRTLLAIAVALDVFGPQGVIVYLAEWLNQIARFGVENATPLRRYIESYGARPAGLMFWEGYSLIPGGRSGYLLGYLTSRKRPSFFRGDHCRAEILYAQHSHFDLYGNFISGFCGGLSVGDWHNLPEVLADFQSGRYPRLIQILVTDGPYGLFQIAHREYGYKPLRYGYAGKCHLCVDVRKHLASFNQYLELSPVGFYREELFGARKISPPSRN
jgi:hypothetical protein